MSSTHGANLNKRTRLMNSKQSCVDDPHKEAAATRKALKLPEILQMIFTYLDTQSKGRSAQVTWLWHDTIEEPRLWRHVTVAFVYDETKPLEYMIKPVKSLAQHDIDNMTITQPYCRSFPMLTKLTICTKSPDIDMLIKYIQTGDSDKKPSEIVNKTIHVLVQRFRNVVTLTIGYLNTPVANDASMTLIVSSLKALRHLDISRCNGMTDMGVASLCGWNGVTSDGNVPTLHSLSLRGNVNLTDEGLKYLSIGQRALRSLDLSGCVGITIRGFKFLTHLVDLRILNIVHCEGISEVGIAQTVAQMLALVDLDLSYNHHITRVRLDLVATGVSRLTSLKLSNCFYLVDACALGRLTHLTKLDLFATSIGDSVLQCLADGAVATVIDTLNVSCCNNLTPEAGRHLAKLLNLRVVNLSHSPIGDAGLGHLADAADSRIEILLLYENEDITDAGLAHVKRLPRLRELKR